MTPKDPTPPGEDAGKAERLRRKAEKEARKKTRAAWPQPPERRMRQAMRRLEPVFGLLVLAALVLAWMNAGTLRSWLHLGSGTAGAAEPIAAPPTADPDAPTMQHPFAGSPAANWAAGAAGIVPPAPKAVGSLTAAQVGEALSLAKQYLVGTNLDPQVLRGARPAAALAVLAPQDRAAVLDTLAHPTAKNDPLGYLTRYNPEKLQPVGGAIKVRGSMAFSAGPAGSVAVHADYTFVYPFTEAGTNGPLVTRSIVRRIVDLTMTGSAPGTLSLVGTNTDEYNQPCDFTGGYLEPQFSDQNPSGSPGTGRPADPYNRSTPLAAPTQQGCGTVTRS